MHFYRPLSRIAALTFDLDDTLYDNGPVIAATEAASLRFLQHYHPRLQQITANEVLKWRLRVRATDPDIYHDVTHWRQVAITRALTERGFSASEAARAADEAMVHFAECRSQIDVPQETHDVLTQLARRWPLVAITNGNADPSRCGLADYFQFTLRAGPDGRSKPYGDMFYNAARQLGVAPGELLHVGDDLTTDVAGAVRAGVQACWINLNDVNLLQHPASRLVPHLAISQLVSLCALI